MLSVKKRVPALVPASTGTLKNCYHLDTFEIRLGGSAGGGPGSFSASPADIGLFTDGDDEDELTRGGRGGGVDVLLSSSDVGLSASGISTLTGKNEHVRLFCKVWGDFGGNGGGLPWVLSRLIFSDWCLFSTLSG